MKVTHNTLAQALQAEIAKIRGNRKQRRAAAKQARCKKRAKNQPQRGCQKSS